MALIRRSAGVSPDFPLVDLAGDDTIHTVSGGPVGNYLKKRFVLQWLTPEVKVASADRGAADRPDLVDRVQGGRGALSTGLARGSQRLEYCSVWMEEPNDEQ